MIIRPNISGIYKGIGATEHQNGRVSFDYTITGNKIVVDKVSENMDWIFGINPNVIKRDIWSFILKLKNKQQALFIDLINFSFIKESDWLFVGNISRNENKTVKFEAYFEPYRHDLDSIKFKGYLKEIDINFNDEEKMFPPGKNGIYVNFLNSFGLYRFDDEGRFIMYNSVLANILGYKNNPEELYGMYESDFFLDKNFREEMIILSLKNPEAKAVQYKIKNISKKTINISDSVRPVFDDNNQLKYFEGLMNIKYP